MIRARLEKWVAANATLGSISVLMGGAIGAQLVVVLASPLLTRLYTPEQFGFLAVFSALMNTLLVVANLRYQTAVPLARDERRGVATLVLSLVVGVAIASLLAVLVALAGRPLAALANVEDYAAWLYLLPLAVLFAGWFETFRAWSVRTRAFVPLARARFRQSVVMTVIQIAGFKSGVAALVIGQVAGRAAGFGLLAGPFRRDFGAHLKTLRRAELVEQAVEFRRFPLQSTWGTLLNVASRQFPAVFFAAAADPAVAGLFALAQRILATPLTLVSDAISNVFMSNGVRAFAEGRLGETVVAFNRTLCLLAAVPIVGLVVLGPPLFAFVFGDEWSNAGLYAAIMAPWIFLVFVSTPAMAVFSITGRDAELSLHQLTLAIARVVALFGGWLLGDAIVAIALFSAVSAIAYVIMSVRVHVLAGLGAGEPLGALALSLGGAALVLSPLWLHRASGRGEPLVVAALVTVTVTLYYVWLARRILSGASQTSR